MGIASYLPIEWVEDYHNLPKSAKYILRILSNSVIFEEYDELKNSITLKEFPKSAIDELKYIETLTECRNIIGNDEVIWVEMPFWKWIKDHSDSKTQQNLFKKNE